MSQSALLSPIRAGFARAGRRTVSWLLALALTLGNSAPGFAQWDFGGLSAPVGRPSPPLTISMSRGSVGSMRFVGRVGGVAFMQEAKPVAALLGAPLTIRYDAGRPDGKRLVVTIGGASAVTSIPDWQLAPIARFADSPHNSVVSMFGSESEDQNYYAVQYHNAMSNTLLGLRMVQADALLMDLKAATTLPKWQENTVLGLGEQLPDTMAAFASAIEVGQVLRRGQWQSWVLTDRDVDVVFSVSNGELVLTGEPFYYFWRFGRAHDALVQSLETTQTRFNTNVDAYNALVPRVNMARSEAQQRPLLARLKELEKSLRTDSLALARLDETLDADVEGVTTLTTALRAKTAALARVNPAVYSAARRTLRYSAFFRYVKGSNPGNWQEFMTAMESVHPQPIVSTPTQFPKHSRARVH